MAGEVGLEPTMSESKSDVFPVTPFPKVEVKARETLTSRHNDNGVY